MLNSFPVLIFVGTILGFLAGLGIGGGSLLLLWLTMVIQTDPQTARSINLLFFLPCAAVSLWIRRKNANLALKKMFPAILSGCLSAMLISWLGNNIDTQWLKRGFGILLVITGMKELCYRPRKFK